MPDEARDASVRSLVAVTVEVFETDRVLTVIWNTLVLMLVAATATMLLAFIVLWIIVRSEVKGSV